MMAASSPATQFWRDRGPLEWARVLPTYWDAVSQPHRAALIKALRAVPRFESIRELGCCAGTNLFMIRQTFPWAMMEGLEVSPEAAIFAQGKFATDPQVRVVCGDMLHEADTWDPHDVDVVFSCYSLAYVAPEDLDDLLAAMVRSASTAVILVEPMHGDLGKMPVRYTCEWRHDYANALARALTMDGRPARLQVEKLDTPTESCDGLAVVTFQ